MDHGDGGVPADAGVGDALAVGEGGEVVHLLGALDEVALDHDGGDGGLAGGDLGGDVGGDDGLAAVVLAAVRVAAIDHEIGIEAGGDEFLLGVAHGVGVVVGAGGAAAQDDVAGVVAGGLDDGGIAGLGDGQKMVGLAGGLDGVEGDLDIPPGAVFEPDGHAEAGGELAMDLALGGAGADGSPGDEVGVVLGGDGIEELIAGRHAAGGEVEEELAGDVEAFVDVVGIVEAGVVDEAFPPDGGAGLLEIDPHDEADVVAHVLGEGAEAVGVFQCGGGIVNGAGPDDGEEAMVAAFEDGFGLAAGIADKLGGLIGDGQLVHQDGGRNELVKAGDTEVVGRD